MKTERKLLTGTLLALCGGALLALCIVLAAGWSKAAKPTLRCRRCGIAARRSSGNTATKPIGTTWWRFPSCGALPEKNGKDGADGKGRQGRSQRREWHRR